MKNLATGMTRGILSVILILWSVAGAFASEKMDSCNRDRLVIAYVTSWSEVVPDPQLMTHINYAFGHVSDSFDGIRVDNPERLRKIVALREGNPRLRVLLSIGGWTSGRFSEMAASDSTRAAFCRDARRIVDEFGLDGIDIDWEYPGSSEAGISSSDKDIENFTSLMLELRRHLGRERLLTLATYARGKYYDFKSFIDAVDFVNMMSYDMNRAPLHHAPLFSSGKFPGLSVEQAMKAHLDQGVPASKLCMGLPFYGRGTAATADYVDFRDLPLQLARFTRGYDPEGRVPYLSDSDGNPVLGFDDPESLTEKCRYALDNGLRGVMYWECAADDASSSLAHLLRDLVLLPR